MVSFRAVRMSPSHLARPSAARNAPLSPRARRPRIGGGPSLLLALVAGLLLVPARAPALAAASVVTLTGHAAPDASGGARVTAVVEVKPGYHVNAHQPDEDFLIPTVLSLSSPGVDFAEPEYPTPVAQRFAFAGDEPLLVYSGRFEIHARALTTPQQPIALRLRYQACDDERCLPPATAETTVRLGEAEAAAPVEQARLSYGGPADGSGSPWRLAETSLPAALLVALLLGLTLNLTPCVYPLVSVTIGYFGSQTGPRAARRVPLLASVYVLGITLSFAAMGVSAALFGGLFGAPLQHPAVLVGLALLMVVLAGASFGFYEIRAPASLMSKVGGASAGVGGALFMGLTMGIVAAPCIGPVVLGVLTYVSAQRDVLLGFLLFFALGLGMGLPYVFLASVAGSIRALPRAGEWLAWVNRFFGTMLLGMALYFVSPLLDATVLAVVVPLYLAAAGLYLGFLEPSGRALRWFLLGRRAFGVVVLLLALWFALPSAQAREEVRWQPLTEEALAGASQERRPAIVEFAADWCLPCLEMKRTTFVDPDVAREAERFATFVADVTESSPRSEELLARFGVVGVPTFIFYAADGAEVERLVGYVDAGAFVAAMRRVAGASGAPQTAPSELARLGEERRDVVAAEGLVVAADHVRAQRVDGEPSPREQLVEQVGEARREEEAHVAAGR